GVGGGGRGRDESGPREEARRRASRNLLQEHRAALECPLLGEPGRMAGRIFINYRRTDSIGTAGRLRDRLARELGRRNVFMDVDSIPAGVDFARYLESQVGACRVFLAVIGPNWLGATAATGRPRLGDPADP